MIKVGAAGKVEFSEEFWQRVSFSQGVNQPRLLLVAQERQVDAQAFFNSSLAFLKCRVRAAVAGRRVEAIRFAARVPPAQDLGKRPAMPS